MFEYKVLTTDKPVTQQDLERLGIERWLMTGVVATVDRGMTREYYTYFVRNV